MAFVGLAITFLGFLVAVASLGMATSNGARLVIVLVGIAISLTGIMAVLNPAYQKDAIWKKK
jgi:cytochrome c biogenesis protein CcdA